MGYECFYAWKLATKVAPHKRPVGLIRNFGARGTYERYELARSAALHPAALQSAGARSDPQPRRGRVAAAAEEHFPQDSVAGGLHGVAPFLQLLIARKLKCESKYSVLHHSLARLCIGANTFEFGPRQAKNRSAAGELRAIRQGPILLRPGGVNQCETR